MHFVCRLSPHQVHVEITDEGPGFAPDSLPDPTDDAFLERPGGRGVLLMRAFMSRVSFNPSGNHVILERDRTEAARQKIETCRSVERQIVILVRGSLAETREML